MKGEEIELQLIRTVPGNKEKNWVPAYHFDIFFRDSSFILKEKVVRNFIAHGSITPIQYNNQFLSIHSINTLKQLFKGFLNKTLIRNHIV